MNRLRLLFFSVLASCGVVRAQSPSPSGVPTPIVAPQPAVILVVSTLRDAGGLGVPEAGKNPINERFTTGIRSFLSDSGKGHFGIAEKWPEKTAPGASYLSLEGELSHLEDLGAYGGSYLCTLRLFTVDFGQNEPSNPARRLIGQWSGYARTLRYLTSNLMADSRVSNEGLLGELGTRISAQVRDFETRSPGLQMARLTAVASKPLPSGLAAPIAAPLQITFKPTQKAGFPPLSGFRLQISSPFDGSVYLVVPGAPNQPALRLIPLSKTETQLSARRAALLPATRPLTLPSNVPIPEVLVLVRNQTLPNMGGVETAPIKPKTDQKPAPAPPKTSPNLPQTLPPLVTPSSATPVSPPTATPPVHVIGEGLPPGSSAPLDPGVLRLMRQMERDPAGTWLARRFVINLASAPTPLPVPAPTPTPLPVSAPTTPVPLPAPKTPAVTPPVAAP